MQTRVSPSMVVTSFRDSDGSYTTLRLEDGEIASWFKHPSDWVAPQVKAFHQKLASAWNIRLKGTATR